MGHSPYQLVQAFFHQQYQHRILWLGFISVNLAALDTCSCTQAQDRAASQIHAPLKASLAKCAVDPQWQ